MSPSHLENYCPSCGRKYPPADQAVACVDDGTELLPVTEDPLVGQIIAGKFKIIDVLGTGGYSTVYRAQHLALDRSVAFKLLRSDLVASAERLKRFEQEARLASSLKHKNICSVYDCGVLETGQPYLVMENLKGRSLAHVLEQRRDGPLEGALSLLKQIAAGLRTAHENGIVHRDLKPANIMLVKSAEGETAKIIDFGIAKIFGRTEDEELTATGASLGTPSYMSPEQIRGETVDARSDIYAFGCVMYEILTGRRAFEGRTTFETMQRHLGADPPPMMIGDRSVLFPLREVTLKCVSKDPGDRFQSVDEIENAFEALDTEDILGAEISVRKRKTEALTHWAWMPLAAVGVLFLGLAALKISSSPSNDVSSGITRPRYDQAIVKMIGEFKSLQQSGRQDAAERVGKRTYDVLVASGRQHTPEMVMVSKELQDFYVRNYRRTEASPYVKRAFEAQERIYGDNPAALLKAHRDAAKGFVDAAQSPLALKHLEQVLLLTSKQYGEESAQYCEALHEYTRAEVKSGINKDVEANYEVLFALISRVYPGNSEKLLQAMTELCEYYIDRNQPAKAKEVADRTIALLKGDTSRDMRVQIFRTAAHAAKHRGDLKSAADLISKAIDLARQAESTWLVGELLTVKGAYLRQAKNNAQAEAVLKEGISLVGMTHGLHSNEYLYSLNEYIKLLEATSRSKEAESVRKAGRL